MGSAMIRATQWITNASYNQRQRFFPLSPVYSRKSARTERRRAFGSAKHVLASYLVVKSRIEKWALIVMSAY
jgi:hypothetical protein